jgi:hypothetical protein
MGITLPTHGQTLWDNPLNLALRHLMSASMVPNDHGFINWSQDPALCAASANPTSGTVRMVKLPPLPETYTITNVATYVSAAGVALTANQCFVGLYDSAGTRVAVSLDQSANWTTTGLKIIPLVAPYVVAANTAVWMATLYNGTSLSFAVSSNVGVQADLVNANLAAAVARYTLGPAAQTSLPASVTMGARTNSSGVVWNAVS